MPATTILLRERLEGLMLFRVVLATLFLGGALAVDVATLSDLSDLRNTAILTLIVGTYVLTIVYALLLRRRVPLRDLAVFQIVIDVITVLVTVDVTGGLDSPFLFLFLLTIVNSAVVLGRRGAINTAIAAAAALSILAIQQIGLFEAVPAAGYVWKTTIFRVATNASAGFIVAVLAGALAERLGEATSQLAAQQSSIRELKALNENILASLSSGLLTVDKENTVIFFNLAAARIIERTSDEVLGLHIREVLPDIAHFVEAANDGELEDTRMEAAFHREDGSEVYLGFSVSVLQNADGEDAGRIVIFQDLSDIKRLENDMRRSERLAAVGRLSAAIAHEIRNPLASISGSVEMLSTGAEASDDDRTLMSIILREVGRLDKLISDFLEYTRPRPLSTEVQDPVPIICNVLELFRNRRDESIEVRFEPPGEPARVRVDGEAFQQVMWNLFNNASEATANVERPLVQVTVQTDETSTTIRVADNGPGIADEDLDRVFQPFFTTKIAGSGLGLATIYRIVEEHGATIAVHPHGDLGGACFEIKFPAESV